MGDADNEQEEELAKPDEDNAAKSKGTQENDEEYVELEMYKNEYYTQESNSEGLFALTEVPAAKHGKKEPGNKGNLKLIWEGGLKIMMREWIHAALLLQEFHQISFYIAPELRDHTMQQVMELTPAELETSLPKED
ncbi:hypothetical protein C0989_004160, partial [Termitomyces sp. Mn162]